ncbi:MAG: hypothetical protein WC548_03220 [Candidatus Pacearchaeota archaeon]
MKESTIIIIFTMVLLAGGLISIFFSSEFNFYKSDLLINELKSARLITATQAKMYLGIYAHSSTFATNSGSVSGGHVGAGSGGSGGGR